MYAFQVKLMLERPCGRRKRKGEEIVSIKNNVD